MIFLMFQRFYNKAGCPGTGIGLAIVKKIIDRHGGSVWVESEEGKGATFFFTISKAKQWSHQAKDWIGDQWRENREKISESSMPRSRQGACPAPCYALASGQKEKVNVVRCDAAERFNDRNIAICRGHEAFY